MSDEEFHYWRVLEAVGGSAVIAWFATSVRAFTQILRNTGVLNRLVEDSKAHDEKLDKVVTKVDILGESVVGHHRAQDMTGSRGKPDE